MLTLAKRLFPFGLFLFTGCASLDPSFIIPLPFTDACVEHIGQIEANRWRLVGVDCMCRLHPELTTAEECAWARKGVVDAAMDIMKEKQAND